MPKTLTTLAEPRRARCDYREVTVGLDFNAWLLIKTMNHEWRYKVTDLLYSKKEKKEKKGMDGDVFQAWRAKYSKSVTLLLLPLLAAVHQKTVLLLLWPETCDRSLLSLDGEGAGCRRPLEGTRSFDLSADAICCGPHWRENVFISE